MTEIWLRELEHYRSLTKEQKILWLSRLLFLVSMLARDTYKAGTESIDKPEELRRYNELLHRISSKQLDVILNEEGVPDKQFFEMASEETDSLHINKSALTKDLYKTDTISNAHIE